MLPDITTRALTRREGGGATAHVLIRRRERCWQGGEEAVVVIGGFGSVSGAVPPPLDFFNMDKMVMTALLASAGPVGEVEHGQD